MESPVAAMMDAVFYLIALLLEVNEYCHYEYVRVHIHYRQSGVADPEHSTGVIIKFNDRSH